MEGAQLVLLVPSQPPSNKAEISVLPALTVPTHQINVMVASNSEMPTMFAKHARASLCQTLAKPPAPREETAYLANRMMPVTNA